MIIMAARDLGDQFVKNDTHPDTPIQALKYPPLVENTLRSAMQHDIDIGS